MSRKLIALGACCLLVAGCNRAPIKPSDHHIKVEPAAAAEQAPGAVPPPVTQVAPVPLPKPPQKFETYSVSVVNVPVQELLFALARDAKLNVDVHPGLQGNVTLNAVDQTLPQILNRISRQVDMRYEVDGPNLMVMPDAPYLRHYKVDYVNMSRDSQMTAAIATQVATTGGGAVAGAGGGGGSGGGNNSTTTVTNTAKNRFWETLVANIKDLLRETDKVIPAGTVEAAPAPAPAGGATAQQQAGAAPAPQIVARSTFREAASVIANPETGILSIRATARQHERVQEFLDQVLSAAKRQVMIEATVLEVQLSNNYQQGIDWSAFIKAGGKWTITQASAGLPSAVTAGLFSATYTGSDDFRLTVKLLESFGTVKVLSSPKLSVINNQTALLKVVDNRVYFTIKAESNQNQTTTVTTFTTTVNTVPVGFVMSVTPQISENDMVLLNVRPTISRITGFVNDPNPALANPCGTAVCGTPPIVSRIPEVQTREMESVIRVESGQTAVMGGLMQDEVRNTDDTLPGAGQVPLLGELFTQRNDTTTKSELVIFMRPVVVRQASLDGDYRSLRGLLPDDNFFQPQLPWGGIKQSPR